MRLLASYFLSNHLVHGYITVGIDGLLDNHTFGSGGDAATGHVVVFGCNNLGIAVGKHTLDAGTGTYAEVITFGEFRAFQTGINSLRRAYRPEAGSCS